MLNRGIFTGSGKVIPPGSPLIAAALEDFVCLRGKIPSTPFKVGQTDWPQERYILIYAKNGKDAKVLSQHHLDYNDWLKLFPNRVPDMDQHVNPNAIEAYVHTP